MTLLDDTYDCCGLRFDPMGDPLVINWHERGRWAVRCYSCYQKSFGETPLEQARAKLKANDRHLSVEQWDALRDFLEALDG